jgi:hypothetical protein
VIARRPARRACSRNLVIEIAARVALAPSQITALSIEAH